jgi:hypothetical protein
MSVLKPLTFKAWPAQRVGAHLMAKLSRKQVSFGLRQLRHSTMWRKRRRISAEAQGTAEANCGYTDYCGRPVELKHAAADQ